MKIGNIEYKISTTCEVEKYSGKATTVEVPATVEIEGKTYSVTAISGNAFAGNKKVENIVLPNTITNIASGAFQGCVSLVSITMPSAGKLLRSDTFKGCVKLSSIVIPESVEQIGQNAFEECKSLESITIPDTVTRVNNCAFKNCENLKIANLSKGMTSIVYSTFVGCSNLKEVNIPDSIKEIENYAFEYCKGLEVIHLPNSITSIGAGAFYGCKNLVEVNIPDSVEKIESGAFHSCCYISQISIPEACEVDSEAFDEDVEIIRRKCDSSESNSGEDEKKLDEGTTANCGVITCISSSISASGRDMSKYAINGEGSYNKSELGAKAVALATKLLVDCESFEIEEALAEINKIMQNNKMVIASIEEGFFDEKRCKVVDVDDTSIYVNTQWTVEKFDEFLSGMNALLAKFYEPVTVKISYNDDNEDCIREETVTFDEITRNMIDGYFPLDDYQDFVFNTIQNYICENCDEDNGENPRTSEWNYLV